MGLGCCRLGQKRGDHVGMAPRLEHERPPEGIRMAPQPIALLEHRPARRAGNAVDDEAQRVAARVRVDRPDRVNHVTEYASTTCRFAFDRRGRRA